jgi:hypothetical protein
MAAGCNPQEPKITLGVYSGRHYNTDKEPLTEEEEDRAWLQEN